MRTIKILCIEDNPGDARFIRELLVDDSLKNYELTHYESFDSYEKNQDVVAFDVVLLDLSLGDSSGTDTIERMLNLLPDTPIIVLTGTKNEELAEKTIQMGAQDYLVKGDINTSLLTRSIRYSIDRYQLSVELAISKQLEKQQIELQTLAELEKSGSSKITGLTLGIRSLHEHSPTAFQGFVQNFGELMDKALEMRAYKVDYDLTSDLQLLANDLGFSFANPQDLVEIYSSALKEKMQSATYEASQVYLEEGRILLLKVMGYLLSFYRKYVPVNMIYKTEKKN